MTVFVYDSELRADYRRNWDYLVGLHTSLRWKNGGVTGGIPQKGDVIVAHREPSEITAVLDSLAQIGVYVVDVSLNGDPRQSCGYRYSRRKGVANEDTHFSLCFKNFLDNLSISATPPWHLLEGPPAPDALLAYHLLSLIPSDDHAMEACEKLTESAKKEIEQICTIQDLERPSDILFNANLRREFLKNHC